MLNYFKFINKYINCCINQGIKPIRLMVAERTKIEFVIFYKGSVLVRLFNFYCGSSVSTGS